MNFYDILCEDACLPQIPGKSRDEVLRHLADEAAKRPQLQSLGADRLFQALLEREKQGSTGIGNGLAIPHARLEELDQFVMLIATSRKGVEFDAIDKKKVKVFFLIFGPKDAVREHLKTLAGISSLATHTNICRQLENSITSNAMYEAFMSRITEEQSGKTKEAMKLMALVLYEEKYLYDILEFFIEEGIDGATILESSGMGQYISNIPLFASFIGFMNEDRNRSNTIIATVPASRVERLVRGIEGITGDLDKTQGAMIMVLDVAFSKGSMKMM
jgi:PTS system nitrogen regulatory IIA component